MAEIADLAAYRPNVGIVLFNGDGLTWVGKRFEESGPWVWQWPQGGMDAGEPPQEAAYRELFEETGIRSDQAVLLGSIEGWLAYDFPPEVLALPDADFDLTTVPPQEFESFRWERLERVPELIIPWKRAVYEQVVEAFSGFARP